MDICLEILNFNFCHEYFSEHNIKAGLKTEFGKSTN